MTLIIGERYRPKLKKSLENQGISVLWLPDNPDIDPRLAGHADLSVFMPSPGTLVAAKGICSDMVNFLTNRGYRVICSREQGKAYPIDAGLCLCATGRYTIYNPKTVDAAALSLIAGVPVAVNQGYTKCSVCVVSDDAIITADSAIASRAADAGMDVCKIQPGYVLLEGFDYGFIGGASFLLDEKHLAFTGTLEQHPDKERIFAFLKKHGVQPVFLTNEPVFDIGGAVALP